MYFLKIMLELLDNLINIFKQDFKSELNQLMLSSFLN
jgi:hypothetical protein